MSFGRVRLFFLLFKRSQEGDASADFFRSCGIESLGFDYHKNAVADRPIADEFDRGFTRTDTLSENAVVYVIVILALGGGGTTAFQVDEADA
ncbi:MAG: hypothetical protein MJZ46_07955, partial [Bacteroidales bacterium]|nr:hypothetical protein [Bacteroidales bacterium]